MGLCAGLECGCFVCQVSSWLQGHSRLQGHRQEACASESSRDARCSCNSHRSGVCTPQCRWLRWGLRNARERCCQARQRGVQEGEHSVSLSPPPLQCALTHNVVNALRTSKPSALATHTACGIDLGSRPSAKTHCSFKVHVCVCALCAAQWRQRVCRSCRKSFGRISHPPRAPQACRGWRGSPQLFVGRGCGAGSRLCRATPGTPAAPWPLQ